MPPTRSPVRLPAHSAATDAAADVVRALPNGAAPLDGVFTAAQPSAAQLQALARAGVGTVVDLRAANESRGFDEAAVVAEAGMTYQPIPVTPQTLGAAEFDAVRAVLRERGDRPVLVHCASANRVGALLIPYLVLDEGRAPDEALRIATAVGLRSDDLAQAAFAYVRDAQR